MEQSFHSLTIFVALGCQVETPPSHFGGRPAHEDIADVENYVPDHWFKPAFIGSLSRVAVGEYLKNRDRLALQGPKSRCPGWVKLRRTRCEHMFFASPELGHCSMPSACLKGGH